MRPRHLEDAEPVALLGSGAGSRRVELGDPPSVHFPPAGQHHPELILLVSQPGLSRVVTEGDDPAHIAGDAFAPVVPAGGEGRPLGGVGVDEGLEP